MNTISLQLYFCYVKHNSKIVRLTFIYQDRQLQELYGFAITNLSRYSEETKLIKREKFLFLVIVIVASITLWGCSPNKKQIDTEGTEITQEVTETEEEVTDVVEATPEVEEDAQVENGENATEQEPKLSDSEKKALEATQILEGHMAKNLTYAPLNDPKDEYNLNIVKNIHMLAIETGEYSINHTKTNYGVGGTDLGISFNLGDKTYIAYGDTFMNEGMVDGWRSNVLAVTSDIDYTDGILFDTMVSKPGIKNAKELIPSRKVDNVEMTTIPTGGIAIGETLYMSFMSVRHWGTPGGWDCNYGSIAKSVDYGENWEVLTKLQWPGDSNFCQMAPVIIEDYVYILGITGGRSGAAKLMRVPVKEYENFEAYEYLMGYDEKGNPIYEKGQEAIYKAYNLLPKSVGEMSVLYNKYLEEWLVTYIDGAANLVIRSAKNIYGPYSKPVIIAAQKDFPGLYGAFMNPKWVSEDGKKLGFMMSIFDPVYNTVLIELELER